MLRVATLGEISAWIGERRVSPTASRLFPLLLFLAAEADRWLPRSSLQSMLFPESDEGHAAHALRQLVYRLRQLGLSLDGNSDAIRLASELVVSDIRHLLEGALPADHEIDRIAGGFLPDYSPDFSESYREWFDAYRARCEMRLLDALRPVLEAARRDCDWRRLEAAARACLRLDPLGESANFALARAQAMAGSRDRAVIHLDRYLRELGDRPLAAKSRALALRERIVRDAASHGSASAGEISVIGRSPELARLRSAMRQCKTAGLTAIAIWGEVGIGKSRLLSELQELVTVEGGTIGVATARPELRDQPLGICIELVHRLLSLPGALGCSPTSLSALRRLTHLGEPDAGNTLHGAEPLRSSSLEDAISDLVGAIASEAPLAIAIDDAHFIDEPSAELLGRFMRRARGTALSFVVTSSVRNIALTDPQQGIDWGELRLGGLRPADCQALVAEVERQRNERIPSDVRHWCIETSAGNPLFLQLLASHYAATRTRSIPHRITDLLERKIGSLSSAAQTVLDACVILGRNSLVRNIETLVGLSRAAFLAALRELEEANLLNGATEQIAVLSPATAEVVLQKMPSAVRRALHAFASRLLTTSHQQSGDVRLLWDAVDHCEAAGEVEAALGLLQTCAAHSRAMGRPHDAVRLLERATRLPTLTADQYCSLLVEAVDASEAAGDWHSVDRLLTQLESTRALRWTAAGPAAIAGVQRLDAKRAGGNFSAVDTRSASRLIHSEGVARAVKLRAAATLLTYAEENCDPQLAESTWQAISRDTAGTEADDSARPALIYHSCFGSIREASRLAGGVRDRILAGHGFPEPFRLTYTTAIALTRVGQGESGITLLSDSLERLRACRSLSEVATCGAYLGWISAHIGDWERAAEYQACAEAAARESNVRLIALHAGTDVEIAIARGDATRALAGVERLRSHCTAPSLRMELHILQLEVRARTLAGRKCCSSSELARLMAGHRKAQALGLHDDVVEALVLALRAHGRAEEIPSLLEVYRALRRDPFPARSLPN